MKKGLEKSKVDKLNQENSQLQADIHELENKVTKLEEILESAVDNFRDKNR